MSDYAPGTRLKPAIVNITFGDDLQLAHVGIGYHLLLPSGRKHEGGFTWHSPAGEYAQGPADHIENLQAVMDALLQAAADREGVELARADPIPSAAR